MNMEVEYMGLDLIGEGEGRVKRKKGERKVTLGRVEMDTGKPNVL